MKKIIGIISVLLSSAFAVAHNKVAVIPMGDDKHLDPSNLIIVAKDKGEFHDPILALNSINDAAVDNRYRIFIEPGEYILTERLVMKPFVDIIGSGRHGDEFSGSRTALKGSFCGTLKDATSSLVVGANDSSIRSMVLENQCRGQIGVCFALANISASPIVSDITANCIDGSDNSGIYIENASPQLINVTAIGSTIFGSYTQGIWIAGAGSEFQMNHVHAMAVGGSQSVGLFNESTAAITFHRSMAYGDTFGLNSTSNSFLKVKYSSIENGFNGTARCFASDDGHGQLLGNNCSLPIYVAAAPIALFLAVDTSTGWITARLGTSPEGAENLKFIHSGSQFGFSTISSDWDSVTNTGDNPYGAFMSELMSGSNTFTLKADIIESNSGEISVSNLIVIGP